MGMVATGESHAGPCKYDYYIQDCITGAGDYNRIPSGEAPGLI